MKHNPKVPELPRAFKFTKASASQTKKEAVSVCV